MSDEVAAAAWPGSALRVFTGKETFQYGFCWPVPVHQRVMSSYCKMC